MKTTTLLALGASFALAASASAAITYIDAANGTTVEAISGGSWSTGNAWQTAVSSGGDNLYQIRTTGPAANADSTTAFVVNHTEDAPALRMIVTGLDASLTYQFYLYSVNAGGADVIQAAVSSDVSDTATLPSLTTYQNGTNVLADGSEGNVASGDQRTRHTLSGTFTGSTSYAVYIDDFSGGVAAHPGDRVTLDGIGFEVVPEPSSAALLGLGGLALILRRRK